MRSLLGSMEWKGNLIHFNYIAMMAVGLNSKMNYSSREWVQRPTQELGWNRGKKEREKMVDNKRREEESRNKAQSSM